MGLHSRGMYLPTVRAWPRKRLRKLVSADITQEWFQGKTDEELGFSPFTSGPRGTPFHTGDNMARKKPVGWRGDSKRHSLAAQGIKTVGKRPKSRAPKVKGRTEMVGTILVRKEKGSEFTAVPSGTRMPFGMEEATDWKRVNKKVVIRDSKGMRELRQGISRWMHMDNMSTGAAFDKPVFVRGSVVDQLALAIHQYKKKLPSDIRKTTYFEAFHIGSGTYYAYMHDDGSFVIRKQTKGGDPPGRGS